MSRTVRIALALGAVAALGACTTRFRQHDPPGDASSPDARVDAANKPDGAALDGAQPDARREDARIIDAVVAPDGPPVDGSTVDTDGDGVYDHEDNCPLVQNSQQQNSDSDDHGDACDNCPDVNNNGQGNTDTDSWGNVCDNCPNIDNQSQDDLDGDDVGDACDPDLDGDGVPNEHDPHPTYQDTVIYYSDFSVPNSDFEFQEGTWAFTSGALCQTDDTATHTRARLDPAVMTATDYIVQTEVAVISMTGPPANYPAVGPLMRASDISPSHFNTYVCAPNLREYRLEIISYINDSYFVIDNSGNNAVSTTGPYQLKATADIDTIICELESGPSLSLNDTTHTSGTAGLFVYMAHACFDYLTVIAP